MEYKNYNEHKHRKPKTGGKKRRTIIQGSGIYSARPIDNQIPSGTAIDWVGSRNGVSRVIHVGPG